MSVNVGDTQPIKSIKKRLPWRSILISAVGFLVLIGLGAFGGYSSGIGDRKAAESGIIIQQLAEQYQFALVDIQFSRYEAAKQRLEFIITNDPSFPGAQEKLTEVLVLSVIPTPIPTATLTPTPDSSGAESNYQRAVQLIQAQDWSGALTALDQMRKLDSNYKTAQVDGMYYFTLRNLGVLQINSGNPEGGIYYITLAERFGTLDNTAYQLRDSARFYITAASFWELDWKAAAEYFGQMGGFLDSTERFHIAAMRYADQLFTQEEYCAALDWYQKAQSAGGLDANASKNNNEAYSLCYPATDTPEPLPTVEDTPTEPPPPPVDTPTTGP